MRKMSKREKQFRSIVSARAEITRAESGEESRSIVCCCSATDVKYTLWKWSDGFEENETARAGLAVKTIKENGKIFVLHTHDWKNVLANTTMSNVTVWERVDASEGKTGIYFEIKDIPDSGPLFELWENVKNRNYEDGSIGFYVIKRTVEEMENERHIILDEIALEEVTICARGANPHTEAEARAFFDIPDGVEPGGNHSEAGATALDEARDATTSEPEPNHSEEAEEVVRALALRRRRLALRIKLSEVE